MRCFCVWYDENIGHLADNGVSQDEFEAVLANPEEEGVSQSSGLPFAVADVNGRRLFCVYSWVDDVSVLPVTAYEI